jgi:hypothetical protein
MIISAMRIIAKVATRMRLLTHDTKADLDFDTVSAEVLACAANEAGISTAQLTHFINVLAKKIEG